MVGKASRRKSEPLRISVTEAADKLGMLLGKVRDGETVILTKYNLPVAQITKLDAA